MSNRVNANQLRHWVQLHDKHGAGPSAASLLPVTVVAQDAPALAAPSLPAVSVEIELAGVVVRVRDGVAPVTLRTVLACLRGWAP